MTDFGAMTGVMIGVMIPVTVADHAVTMDLMSGTIAGVANRGTHILLTHALRYHPL
jgi:hypothetical protein